jgi:7,8-dihydropterin-6-yl-methyl-4-(beta-D-ribofuranosyl)aminobenzene 5'-phosphate synthase
MRRLVSVVIALTVFFPLTAQAQEGPAQQKALAPQAPNTLLVLFDHRGEDIGEGIPMSGYSALIQYRGRTILFDGGTSAEILEHNARVYGADLRDVDFAVISHSHGDHAAGIDYLLEVNPQVHIYVPDDGAFGSSYGERRRPYRPGFRYQTDSLTFVEEHVEVEPGVHLIPTRSPYTGYFSRYSPEQEAELIGLPELSLALETDDGEVVLISGCSHSGIDRIVGATKSVTTTDVALVTGGLHLRPFSTEYMRSLALMMRDELDVRLVAPTHCTGNEAMALFEEIYGDAFVKTGLGTTMSLPR